VNILEVQSVSKHYTNHTALNQVSFEVPKGSIFGLLGPNGAGKTSLIRIITQITQADEGQILFDGEPLKPKHVREIGYLPEERGLYKKMKVGEQLTYLAKLKGISGQELKEKLKYWVSRFEIGSWWQKPIEDLSKGMQQKIQFIATVLHEPKLLILDEPFSGFDPVNANLIKDEIFKLRDKGCSIIFSTHRMESVEELCDHIALINKAEKVLGGPKAEIKNTYRSGIYKVEADQDLPDSPHLYEKIDKTEDIYGQVITTIKLQETVTVNELLKELIRSVALNGLHEHLPNMNEIFIRTVGRENIPEPA